MKISQIKFPKFTGIRCLMMPFIQGRPESVPEEYSNGYEEIIESVYHKKGDVGYLTIDESKAKKGLPHRGTRSKWGRALHTEAGRDPQKIYCWGDGGGWGSCHQVTLDRDVRVLLSNNIDNSCAIWESEHENTSMDGDIGYEADSYPYEDATMMQAGEVHDITILMPHESLPVAQDFDRQFLRIISSGVHGRESHFTPNHFLPELN